MCSFAAALAEKVTEQGNVVRSLKVSAQARLCALLTLAVTCNDVCTRGCIDRLFYFTQEAKADKADIDAAVAALKKLKVELEAVTKAAGGGEAAAPEADDAAGGASKGKVRSTHFIIFHDLSCS